MTDTLSPSGTPGKNGTDTPLAEDLILKDRGSVYGDSGVNFACAYEMATSYNMAHSASPVNRNQQYNNMPSYSAHQMAITMILMKLARIATGVPHADNYDDIIGYTKLAKQHAIKESK